MNYRDDFYSKTIQIYLLIYFSRMQAKKKKSVGCILFI